MSHRICTGIRRRKLGKLTGELAGPWLAAEEDRLRGRRGHERLRAAGAGPDHRLAFTDRVIVTLVVLRFQLPHAVLAALYEVDRSTVTRAVREVRPLLAARGFAVPGEPGVRLRTLADVSPTRRPGAWNCGWTARKSRSAARPPGSRGAAPSSRARRR